MSNVGYTDSMYNSFLDEFEQRKKHQQEGRKPEDLNLIDILSIDLNIGENTRHHHTEDYEIVRCQPYRLVLRRGQPFVMTLHCNRPFDLDKDALVVEFSFGEKPKIESFTKRFLHVQPKGFEFTWKWGARIRNVAGNHVEVEVKPSATSPVGEWQFKIFTGFHLHKLETTDMYLSYVYSPFIYILFNAWCPEDEVFLDNEELRQAYVLEDHGALFQGAKYNQYSACPWNYGQFEDASLYAALLTLRQYKYLSDADRASTVLVTRRITSAVNDNILEGNWSGNYEGGTAPWKWTGSVAIMEEYLNNPTQCVKYGQCWVFSAVLLTLTRALGIPSRSVTCIRSAHDTDRTLTIDNVYMKSSPRGEYEDEGVGDSVWNFHVWNEAWCKRHDLPPGYDGWQAIDATPQEQSQGRYQCGPMAVKAIQKGEVKLNYDGWFLYGEVNADVVNWYYTFDARAPEGRRLIRTKIDKTDVGRALITSSIQDTKKGVDITSSYKAKEGTIDERKQIRHAIREVVSKERDDIVDLFQMKKHKEEEDVVFEFSDLDMVKLGDNIKSWLKIKNTNPKNLRTVQVRMALSVIRYTGGVEYKVKNISKRLILKTNEESTITLEATGEDYATHIKEHSQMRVDVLAEIEESEEIFAQRDTFQILKPELNLYGENIAYVNLPTTFTISFKNPINETLTGCSLQLEGMGLTRILPIRIEDELPGEKSFSIEHSVLPYRTGKRTILAAFNSDQVSNIRGTLAMNVQILKNEEGGSFISASDKLDKEEL